MSSCDICEILRWKGRLLMVRTAGVLGTRGVDGAFPGIKGIIWTSLPLLAFPGTFYQRGSAQSGAFMCLFAW